MSFSPGWYEIRFDPATRRRLCRFFKSPSVYTMECYLEPNGEQILLWSDPAGETGRGKPGTWSPSYPKLAKADPGDWWDNPPGGPKYNPDNPDAFLRMTRQPTPRELAGRCSTATAPGAECSKEIHVGLFFDGTNNNMERDKPKLGHSNIVTLFDAHKTDFSKHFRYYIPGVGTAFPQIGERTESNDGKAFAAGGEARIHWGMMSVFNAVCRAAAQFDLLEEAEMTQIATTSGENGLSTWWRLGDSKMVAVFQRLNERLLKAVEGKRPLVTRVNLSIYGFSRGAAEARAFNNWIQAATGGTIGKAVLHINFLGLFDTVASVGLADSSPIGSGFMDWADGTMDISGVRRAVHFVAAHEVRLSFPLSTGRTAGTWPEGVKEFVYPGAHSDVGGGYGPGDQGKGKPGRAHMLSQIPLNDMHFAALNAGSALLRLNEMPGQVRSDFAVDGELNSRFDAYANWAKTSKTEDIAGTAGGAPENRLQQHTHMYWRWRSKVSPEASFKGLHSYLNSSEQDQVDLWESELDWRKDVERAREAHKPTRRHTRAGSYEVPGQPSTLQKEILAQVAQAASVPLAAGEFFDRYVHDSHGGFWLLGPQTEFDRATFVREIRKKKARYDAAIEAAKQMESVGDFQGAMGAHSLARGYELNKFERRVVAADDQSPGSFPVMTDADAEDLRDNAGFVSGFVVRRVVGTGTRREPHGHGRYRRVFDKS
jgi:Uncharacterized alpha/beta hydrolase domain (DUF2235)